MKKYKYEGNIAAQISEVTTLIQDWNHDGDIYPIEGIWIEWEDGQREFVSLDHLSYFTQI